MQISNAQCVKFTRIKELLLVFACGVFSQSHAVAATEMQQGDMNAQLNALVNQEAKALKLTLHFEYNKDTIIAEDLPLLDNLGSFFENNGSTNKLLLTGHTDRSGSEEYNYVLSQRRIDNIQKYLEQRYNLAGLNIRMVPYGESRPLSPPSLTDLKNPIDRRVELVLEVSAPDYDNQIKFSSNVKQTLTTTENNTAVLWDVLNQCPQQYLVGHKQLITATQFSKNNRLVLTGSYDASIILWDTATGTKLKSLVGHTGLITDIDFYGESSYAISASRDKTLKMWDLQTGLVEKTFIGHNAGVSSVALSNDKRYVFSGDNEGIAIIWNPLSAQILYTLNAHQGRILNVDISPDSKLALTTGADKLINVWNIQTGEKVRTLANKNSQPTQALFSANGQDVISADASGQLHIWAVETGILKQSVQAHASAVKTLAIDPNGDFILTGDNTRTAKLWDTSRLSLYKTFAPDNEKITPFKGTSPGQIWKHEASGISYSWVPEGCFFIGCDANDKSCNYDTNRGKEVCMDGFWLATHEITQKQWQDVMGSNPAQFANGDTFPVEQVSWDDANSFLCKLNSAGKYQFRLPTEAEWEYACRAENMKSQLTPAEEKDISDLRDGTVPVNEVNTNNLGLYGMNENVWEWVADIYQDKGYAELDFRNPLYTGGVSYRYSSTREANRVNRGGNWSNSDKPSLCSFRGFDNQQFKSFYIGLRPVMVPIVKNIQK